VLKTEHEQPVHQRDSDPTQNEAEQGNPSEQQVVDIQSGGGSDSGLELSGSRCHENEHLEAIVAWTKHRREVDDAAAMVLSKPLAPSESCKAKKSQIDLMCPNLKRVCNVDFSNVMGSSYKEVPSLDIAPPRCKTLWFSGVCLQLLELHTSCAWIVER
jgi:hypothetical protein